MSIIAPSTSKYETYIWLWITTYAFLQPQEVIRSSSPGNIPSLLYKLVVREPLVSLDI